MKNNVTHRIQLAAVLVFAGSIPGVFANGFRLPDQDGFATARGEAFAATADNASAIYYNPAGIAQLDGMNLRAGLYSTYLDPTFSPPGGGATYHNQDKLVAVPQFYATLTPNDSRVSFGFGVFAPFGLGVNWPEKTGFRSVAIKGSLKYITAAPVIALKLAPNFMIGGGPNIDYAAVDLRQGLTPTPNNDYFRFRGDGFDLGYSLGALWQPTEKVSLAAVFRSSSQPNLKGHTTSEMDSVQPRESSKANADFTFPLNAVFGVSYRPTKLWNVEFDADYMDWNQVQDVNIHQDTPSTVVPISNIPFALEWKSSWLYEFGATRYFGNGWQVSAGYVYNENSMPNKHYTPFAADLDRHVFSVGTGYKGQKYSFDIAYQCSYGPDHVVKGSAPSLSGQSADGTYGFLSHVILLSVGVHF